MNPPGSQPAVDIYAYMAGYAFSLVCRIDPNDRYENAPAMVTPYFKGRADGYKQIRLEELLNK